MSCCSGHGAGSVIGCDVKRNGTPRLRMPLRKPIAFIARRHARGIRSQIYYDPLVSRSEIVVRRDYVQEIA